MFIIAILFFKLFILGRGCDSDGDHCWFHQAKLAYFDLQTFLVRVLPSNNVYTTYKLCLLHMYMMLCWSVLTCRLSECQSRNGVFSVILSSSASMALVVLQMFFC